MTDAHLMDADCIHGVTWWDCPDCFDADIVEADLRRAQRREAE